MDPIHILLIEDSEGDIILTQKALQSGKLHIKLDIVRDGEQAIEYLQAHQETPPDLVLLDLNLPRVSGHEVLKFIKTTNIHKSIPVIVLTTSESEKDITKTYNNYANGYIVKPINVQQFFEVVNQIQNFWFTIVKLPNK